MTKIKYDKKDKCLYRKTAVIFSVLAAVNWCFLMKGEDILRCFPVEVEVVFLCSIWPLGMLAVGLWVGYMEAVLYLKRLWKFGYEIPEDKRTFNKDLEQLPRLEHTVIDGRIKSYDSIFLTVLTGIIVIALLIYDICFLYQYSSVGKVILFFEGILFSGTCIWVFLGIFYVRQISDQRYKYDVEIDNSRRNRTNLTDGFVEIALLLVLTLLAVKAIDEAVQYMIKARAGH